MNEADTNYVTCCCQHCGENIEFDKNAWEDSDTGIAACPHCQRETVLFSPPPSLDQPARSMKGTILEFLVQKNQGVISGDNGQRYHFAGSDWKSLGTFPTKMTKVDFVPDAANAREIYEVAQPPIPTPPRIPFGQQRPSEYEHYYRSSDEKTLGGVCGGLSHKLGMFRGGWQFLFLVTSLIWLLGLIVYLFLWASLKPLPTRGVKFSN